MGVYAPFPFSDFSGLDLTGDPDESGCIDAINVDLDRRGSVRSRDGWTSLLGTGAYGLLHLRTDGTLLADKNGTVDAINGAGSVTASVGTSGASTSFADVGTPTASYTYFATGAVLKRFDGSAFAASSGSPVCKYLAAQPSDNRLVAANVQTLPSGSGAASASSSLVHFSDPGAPDTWSANNFIQLTPGDGSGILGMVAWRDLLFVFKNRRFFVFYGNSVDSAGNPVFNYRTIDAGIGVQAAGLYRQLATAAVDGVYFLGNDLRVYRTTGGPAVAVSTPVDPALRNTQSAFSQVTVPSSYYGLTYANGRIMFLYEGSGSTYRQLLYDTEGGYWLYSDFDMADAVRAFASPIQPFYFSRRTGSNGIARLARTATTDGGVGITSRYRSAFTPLNWIRRSGHWYPIGSQEATVRESVIDGMGTIKYSLSRDFGAVPTTGGGAKQTVTLGTSPTVAQGRHTIAQQGRRVSFQIEDDGTGSAWRVYDLTMHIDDARYPGIETS